MLGRAHIPMNGREPKRRSDGVVGDSSPRRRVPGNGPRVGWIIAGILAVAATLTVIAWEIFNRTEDPRAERTGEEPAAPPLLPTRESL
jgi:hypothetical protein